MTTAVYRLKNDPLLVAGPCCVLLSIAVSTLLPTPNGIYFPWLALVGLVLSWKFSLQGLGASLLLSSIIIAYENQLTVWDLGVYVSLFFAWAAIALAVDREYVDREYFEAAQSTFPPPSEIELIAQQQGEIRAQQSLLERLRKELIAQVEKNQENGLVAVQLNLQRQLKEDLEQQVIEVQKDANQYRQEAQKYKGLHGQLREQFELKSGQLDESRQRLFQVEEELTRVLAQIKESECEFKSPWLKDLEQLLEYSECLYEEELDRLRQENALLEEIVSKNLTH